MDEKKARLVAWFAQNNRGEVVYDRLQLELPISLARVTFEAYNRMPEFYSVDVYEEGRTVPFLTNEKEEVKVLTAREVTKLQLY